MGKFKLSDMIPNAWFHKLKDMNKVKNHNKTTKTNSSNHLNPSKNSNQPHLTDQRKSYHFSRDQTDDLHSNSPINKLSNPGKKLRSEPPRKSSKRRRSIKRNRPVSSPISAACSCGSIDSLWTKPLPEEYSSSSFYSDGAVKPDSFDKMVSWSRKCECNVKNDIIIELDHDSVPELAPIITRKQNVQETYKSTSVSKQSYQKVNLSRSCQNISVKVVKENVLLSTTTKTKRLSGNSPSPGLKLRKNSPRIVNKWIQSGRKSFSSKSFAVVKSSKNPWRDFRESMEEMIVENNIRASKDLEELLAFYLSLNSDEYHELIINVFKQIWYDSVRLQHK